MKTKLSVTVILVMVTIVAMAATMRASSARWSETATVNFIINTGEWVTPGELVQDGCSQGYWGASPHLDSWDMTGFQTADRFDAVFQRDVAWNDGETDLTLLEVLHNGGGHLNALGREAVAALLNASHPGVSYPLTVEEVLSRFQMAFDSADMDVIEAIHLELSEHNNLGCPLD